MITRQICSRIGVIFLVGGSILGLMAAEFRGTVQSKGLPVPGASITATSGDQKVTVTSDDRGSFTFPNLAEGSWNLTVEMLGFGKKDQAVTAPQTAPIAVDLKLLTREELLASINSTGAGPASGAPANVPGAQNPGRGGAGRGGNTPQGRGGGQPVLVRDAFQEVDVNQLADEAALLSEGNLNSQDVAALSVSASNSLAVQGSISAGLNEGSRGDTGFNGPPGGFNPGFNNGQDGFPGGNFPGGDFAGGNPGGGRGGGIGGPPGGGGRGGGGGGGNNNNGGRAGNANANANANAKGKGKGKGTGTPNANSFGNRNKNKGKSLYNGNAQLNLSNAALDARSYSVTGANLRKPDYSNQRTGFTVGGPIQIPKLISANRRINFTVDYQNTHNRTGQLSQAVNMPTALERLGDFSQSSVGGKPVVIYDPTNGLPFVDNKIPLARLDQAARTLLNYFPEPNLPFAARNYQTSWNGLNDSRSLNLRFQNIPVSPKDRINFQMQFQSGSGFNPNLFQFIDTSETTGRNANISWSRRLTPKINNQIQLTFSRNRNQSVPFFAFKENTAEQLGIQGTSQSPQNWGPPNLSFTNYGSLNDGNSSLSRTQNLNLTDTISWTVGKHNFQMGGQMQKQQQNQLSDGNGRGTFSFNGRATASIINGAPVAGTGYDMADFLLSRPASANIRYGNPDKYFRSSNYALYLNDDFRMSSKMSWTLGVRWDYSAPSTEKWNRITNLDVSPDFSTVTPITPGTVSPFNGTLPNSLVRPDRNNIAPRVGLAWKPFSRHSLVVRSGYGVYYNGAIYQSVVSNLAQQPPFARNLSVSTSPDNPLSMQTGFLAAVNTLLRATYAIDPNYKIGYAQTWTLSLQQNLPLNFYMSLGYDGTKGTHLDQRFIPNSVAPGAPTSLLPNYYTYETFGGNSIMHSGSLSLNRRFSRGIQTSFSYQMSKAIDNGGTGNQGQIAQDWRNLKAERAVQNGPHNASIQFQLSSGARRNGLFSTGAVGHIARDWNLTSNITMRSGSLLTPTVGGAGSQVSGTGLSGTLRANYTGAPIRIDGKNFNTEAFVLPLPGQWGTASRNSIPGPAQFSLNAQVSRTIRISERRTVDIQAQANNILNRVAVTGWGTTVGSNNFGLLTGVGGMRRINISMRMRF